SLFFTLNAAAEFGDPDISHQAMTLRAEVIQEYEKIRLRAHPSPDSECGRLDAKSRMSDELNREFKDVTNLEYRCFYPGHSFPPTEAAMPVQVNWYEALAYAAYYHTTLLSRASVAANVIPSPKGAPEETGTLSRSIGTWCEDMDVTRD